MIEQYKRDGFCVVRNLLEWSGDCEALAQRLRNSFVISRNLYLREARILSRAARIARIAVDSTIELVAEELGVRDPAFYTAPTMHLMGIDPQWDGVGAHQDWAALQTGLNAVVVWIPLTDVTLDNWPVELVPGSHKLGLLPAKPGAHYSEVDTTGMEFVPIEMKRGDVLFFSAFTVHRTRTPGKGFRAAISHRYEDAADPWFLEHDCYSAQKRVIEREIKFTPMVEQVRRIFD